MIINCGNCSTSFNLDETLLDKKGSKVSCCICENIFTAYPADNVSSMLAGSMEAPMQYGYAAETVLDYGGPNIELETVEEHLLMLDLPELEVDDIEFDLDDIEIDLGQGQAGNEYAHEHHEVDGLLDQDFDKEDGSGFLDEVDNAPSPVENEETGLSFGIEDDVADSGFDLGEEVYPAKLHFDGSDEVDADLPEDSGPGAEEPIEDSGPELSLDGVTESEFFLDKEIINEFDMDKTLTGGGGVEALDLVDKAPSPARLTPADELSEKEQPKRTMPARPEPLPVSAKSGGGASFLKLSALFVSFAGLVFVGMILLSLLTSYNIPVIQPAIDRILTPNTSQASIINVSLDEKTVKGRLINNTSDGNFFVITGEVENNSESIIHKIVVKGTLSTKDNKSIKTKIVYCGNIVADKVLKTEKINTINQKLLKQAARIEYMHVKPGGRVKFAVIFSDLPEKLELLKVEIVKYDTVK